MIHRGQIRFWSWGAATLPINHPRRALANDIVTDAAALPLNFAPSACFLFAPRNLCRNVCT
jgi:hypothetical protein